jgi:acetoin:2,6-dichlorophenolindophenol oxidoreductase subunit alpha
MGKRTGVCKGKGGSMHLADFRVGSLGESAIVGSAIPVATGAGLSARLRESGQVCLCFFGDGAVNTGPFHEALNLASVWKLPVVYLCENNGYAVSTPASYATAVASVADRASSYAMPGVVVDGQDAVAVRTCVADAVARARGGGGPSLVEAQTYRYREHAEFGGLDVGRYRSDDELEAWRARDPIAIHRQRLVEAGVGVAAVEELEAVIDDEVASSIRFARSSPFPDPDEAFEDLYANPFPVRRIRR